MTGVGRASLLLGAGTLASRVTGFARTIVLAGMIGTVGSSAADAFSVANQLPSTVFNLISAGVLTAVLVPQIVRAGAHQDGGNAFISKVFTLGLVALSAITVLLLVVSPLIVTLLLREAGDPVQTELAVWLAYWCAPQIFFYGAFALVGETMNARRVFGPYMWAPATNNIVSIAGFLIIGAIFRGDLTESSAWSPGMAATLGITATLSVALQAATLAFFWRKTGLRIRPDFQWRGAGLGTLGRAGGWTFVMALAAMLAGFYQTAVTMAASGDAASVTVLNNAWLLFMLPYALIVFSIGTPYFTRIAEGAATGDHDRVRRDVSRSIRTLGFFVVGAAAAVAAASVPLSRMLTQSGHDAVEAATVLLAYLVGILPMAVLFIVQRTFYALGDTRTPFAFTLIQCIVVVVTAAAASWLARIEALPIELLAAAVALGQSISFIVQTLIASSLLRGRLGGIGARRWARALIGFLAAALPAAAGGLGLYALWGGADGWTSSSVVAGAAGAIVVGAIVLAIYVGILLLARVEEVRRLASALKNRRR